MDRNNIKGTAYLTIATFVFVISSYAINILLGRYLGPSLYGVYGVITSVLTSINIAQIAGVPQAVSRYVASNEKDSEAILKSGLILQVGLMLVLFVVMVLSAPLVAHVFRDPRFTRYIRLTAFVLPFYGVYSVFIGYYNGRHKFGRQAWVNIVYSLAKLVFVIGLAMLFSLYGAIVGFIVAPIMALLVGFHWPRAGRYFSMSKLATYSLPLIGFAALITLQLSIDLFSVKSLVASAAVAGFYAAAQNIALVPYLGMSAIGQVLFPNISRLVKAQRHGEAADATSQGLRWLLLLLLPLVAVIMATAPGLVHLLYGTKYTPAAGILRVLVLGYIGLTIFAFFANVLNGAGKAGQAMAVAGGGVVVALVACVSLTPHFGAVGAAWGTGIGSVVVALGSLVLARQIVPYQLAATSLARIVAGSGVVLALGWVVKLPFVILPLWWLVLGAVYLGWLVGSRELGAADVALVRRLIPGRQEAKV